MEGKDGTMHERNLQENNNNQSYPIDLETDTARWASPAYQVTFGHVSEITPQQYDYNSFRVSAWGLSEGLSHLLKGYSQSELQSALDWLIISQNAHMVVMLNQAMESDSFDYNMLDQIFVTIDTELFLPRGLRMHVTCVTNIVQIDVDTATLDKFVAVLDPGEARQYVQERRGMTITTTQDTIH